ncbi:MAG: transcription antitermination factor NusB, partial [Deltaproteobacteria bacterium]|nr:transcription antitermination factor NusB [Deltaproteobacteria bacterium]
IHFSAEFHGGDFGRTLEFFWDDKEEEQNIREFAELLARGVSGNLAEIDGYIASASHHWRIDRMAIVDRNILRIATFEMLRVEDIPYKVSLNEAIELAKRFGSEDSSQFINGVLDKIGSILNIK